MAGMFRIRPAEPRRLRQQRGGRGHVTKQYPKQSDLSSCFPGAQGGCLPGLRSHGRRRVTVRDEPPQQPRQRRSGAPRGFQTPGPIGPAELLRGERRLVDDALRGAAGPPARRGLRGTNDERFDDMGLYIRVKPIENGVHRRAKFRRAHCLRRAGDLRVVAGRATWPATKRPHHGIVPVITPCAGAGGSSSRIARNEPSPLAPRKPWATHRVRPSGGSRVHWGRGWTREVHCGVRSASGAGRTVRRFSGVISTSGYRRRAPFVCLRTRSAK